jgi:hypothetical protein
MKFLIMLRLINKLPQKNKFKKKIELRLYYEKRNTLLVPKIS